MILVTGAIRARQDQFDQALELAEEHVARSRQENGCVSHAVYRDLEDPLRLVFVERWESREALAAHFAKRSSREFVTAVAELSAEPPTLAVYEANDISLEMTQKG